MEAKIDLELKLKLVNALESVYKEPFLVKLESNVYTLKSIHITHLISKDFAEKIYGQDNS